MAIANQRGGCHESKGPFELGKLSGGLGHVLLIFCAAGGQFLASPGAQKCNPQVPKLKPISGFKIEAGNWLQWLGLMARQYKQVTEANFGLQ